MSYINASIRLFNSRKRILLLHSILYNNLKYSPLGCPRSNCKNSYWNVWAFALSKSTGMFGIVIWRQRRRLSTWGKCRDTAQQFDISFSLFWCSSQLLVALCTTRSIRILKPWMATRLKNFWVLFNMFTCNGYVYVVCHTWCRWCCTPTPFIDHNFTVWRKRQPLARLCASLRQEGSQPVIIWRENEANR